MTAVRPLLLLLLGLAAVRCSDHAATSLPNWREDQGIYEVYGNTFDRFLELHPFTLLLIHDTTPESKEALELLPELRLMFAKHSVNVVIATMRRNDGPRWMHEWSVRKLPYFRFTVGDDVSVSFRSYPTVDSIFHWVTRLYRNQMSIVQVNSEDMKRRFHAEKNAFYLRYNPAKEDYFELLTKFQMVSPHLRVFYATNSAYDVFDKFNAEDVVIGFKRDFEEPLKVLTSPDKLNRDNIWRFFASYREPSTVDLSEELLEHILEEKVRTAFYFGANINSKTLEAFRYIAFEQKDNFLFVVVGSDEALEAQAKKRLLIDEDTFDDIRIVDFDARTSRVFKVTGTTLQDISASFEKFGAQKLPEVTRTAAVLDDVTGEL